MCHNVTVILYVHHPNKGTFTSFEVNMAPLVVTGSVVFLETPIKIYKSLTSCKQGFLKLVKHKAFLQHLFWEIQLTFQNVRKSGGI